MFKIKPSKTAEIFGWYGMIAVLVAYGLVSFAIIKPQGIIYQLLNITGSVGLLVISAAKKTVQNVVVNIVWIAIGVVTCAAIILH